MKKAVLVSRESNPLPLGDTRDTLQLTLESCFAEVISNAVMEERR